MLLLSHNIIHLMTNKPSGWEDPHHGVNDWAMGWILECQWRIEWGMISIDSKKHALADVVRSRSAKLHT